MGILSKCRQWLADKGWIAGARPPDADSMPGPTGLRGNYDLALRTLELSYPFIDPASGSYREEVMLQFYARVAALIKEGVAPVPALHRAEVEVLQPLRVLQERVGVGTEGLRSG